MQRLVVVAWHIQIASLSRVRKPRLASGNADLTPDWLHSAGLAAKLGGWKRNISPS